MRTIGIGFIALLLAACGGDDPSAQPVSAPTPANASPGGIWSGHLATGHFVIGLIAETGEAHFLTNNSIQYFGTVVTAGNQANANLTGYTAIGQTFSDGTTSGTGSFAGTVTERTRLDGNTTFRTSAGLENPNSVALTYDPIYDRASSLATIAGNFRDDASASVVNITSGGVVFAQSPFNGCVINGTVSIVDSRFNAYRVELTYAGCSGSAAALNGTTFRGLATLDNTETPEILVVGAQGAVGNAGISAVLVLDRT